MSADTEAEGAAVVNKNKRYRRDKPWDTDDIDHWGDRAGYSGQSVTATG